jgi:hypothetical protein
MADHALCVHTHFCLLPRNVTLTGTQFDPMGGVLQSLNEKLAATCYAPNSALRNFERLSYDIGGAMTRWLEENTPETPAQIVAAYRAYRAKWGVGNAMAQALQHTVLPLATERDRRMQVRWGIQAFVQRFGYVPEGMWLPEMAVDFPTLQTLHDNGLKFTILSQAQVDGAANGAGPYWVELPSGDRLAVYVRDDWHSNQLAFSIMSLGGAGRWARGTLVPLRREYGRLLLLALDGETFGYYYPGEEHFLHWLLYYEAEGSGFDVTTLARDLSEHPPTKEIGITQDTAWNCAHGLARWKTGCACTSGDTQWKAILRQAMETLASDLDEVYLDYARDLGLTDPWALREAFLEVRLGMVTPDNFMVKHGLAPDRQSVGLLGLLLAYFYSQRTFVSYAYFYDDLDRLEPYYAITNAERVATIVLRVSGYDSAPKVREALAAAVSSKTGKTGAQMFDEVLEYAHLHKAV